MKIFVLSVLVALTFGSVAFCAPVVKHVVLAGDSITVGDPSSISIDGYADDFELVFDGTTTVVGAPGIDSSGFVGVDPNDSGARTYPQLAIDANPDVIVFMLGINSALRTSNIEQNYDEHRKRIGTAVNNVVFNEFDTLPTNVEVIVLSILPVDGSKPGIDADTNTRLNGTGVASEEDVSFGYNPFYKAEVARRNADAVAGPTYRFVDLQDASQTQTVFSPTLHLDSDGLHLNQAGQTWLAEQVNSQVMAVPESSSFLALSLIAVLSITLRRIRGWGICWRQQLA